jgi:hypothetical protein
MARKTIARAALAALFLALPVTAGEPLPLDRLRAGDADARALFLRRGTPALDELVAARDAEKDPERKQRIADVVAEIERREPHGLRFRVALPDQAPALADANGPDFAFDVVVENRGGRAMVLLPYLTMRVLDAKGDEVKTVRNLGRWGRRKSANLLDDVSFRTVEPGKEARYRIGFAHYGCDPDRILAWKLPAAGSYTLEFTYRYVRAEWTGRCDPDWPALADAERPWNRAPEFTHTFTETLRVG